MAEASGQQRLIHLGIRRYFRRFTFCVASAQRWPGEIISRLGVEQPLKWINFPSNGGRLQPGISGQRGGTGPKNTYKPEPYFDMLEKSPESRRLAVEGKVAPRSSPVSVGVLLYLGFFVAMFPLCLMGQSATTSTLAPTQGASYGTGPQTLLQFAGENENENKAVLSVGASAFYDDNVLSTNAIRVADEAVSLSSHLGIEKQTSNLAFTFDYLPFFMIYRQIDQYDRLNHSANSTLAYRLSPRFVLGLQDAFSYENGILPSITGQQIESGPPPPTGLNQGVFAYTTRTLSNTAGVALTFAKSRRNSFTFSVGYDQRRYGNPTVNLAALYNGLGANAGLQYQYRATKHATFGLLLLHQDTTYRGGVVFGDTERTQIETAYVSLGARLSPTVSVTLFGGPQYVHTLGASTGLNTLAGSLQESGGGSITMEARQTAFDFSFQRSASDGGGVYTSVINTNGSFGARRRLIGRWEGNLNVGVYREDASLFQNANGATNSLTAGVDLSRPIREGSRLHISYNTIHQVSNGIVPGFSNFDRNQVTIGIDFRVKAISLGQ